MSSNMWVPAGSMPCGAGSDMLPLPLTWRAPPSNISGALLSPGTLSSTPLSGPGDISLAVFPPTHCGAARMDLRTVPSRTCGIRPPRTHCQRLFGCTSPLASIANSAPRFAFVAISRNFSGSSNASSTQLALTIDTDRVASSLRAGAVGVSEFGRDRARMGKRLNLTDDFAERGSSAKARSLASSVSDSALLTRFLETGASTNILLQARSSLPACKVIWPSSG